MKGTFVLCAAWATVANSSALRKPSAATSIRAPRLSTGRNLSCSRGSDAGSELATAFDFALAGAVALRVGDVAFADGAFARAGVAAGAGCVAVAVSVG